MGSTLGIGAEKPQESVTRKIRKHMTKQEERREPREVNYAKNADAK